MPGVLTAQHPIALQQLGHHIAIADLGPHEGDIQIGQPQLETEIAHQGTHHPTLEATTALEIARDQIEQLVAIHCRPGVIHHQDPITVAVEGDADVGVLVEHRLLQALQVSGAAVLVDVEPIWLHAQHADVRTELTEDAGRDLVGRTVGAIQHDLHPSEAGTGRYAALAELDVATGRIVDARDLANPRRVDHGHRSIEQLLDHGLELIGQLGAGAGKELDAVVVVRIVRSTDDNAGAGLEGSRQIGDTRCRHGTEQHDVRTGGGQTGLQRRLEHVARVARVLADQHPTAAAAAKGDACRPAQLEHEIRRNGIGPDLAANAIGSEILSCHQFCSCLKPSTAVIIFTTSTVSATS